MLKFLKSLYVRPRLLYAIIAVAAVFMLSFWWHPLYAVAWVMAFLLAVSLLADVVALFAPATAVNAQRTLPEKLSNGDENPVRLTFKNNYSFSIQLELIDEIPEQFQKRDFLKQVSLKAKQESTHQYTLKPVERGEYVFGKLNCYASTRLGLARRRYQFQDQQMVKVYPSIIQMRKHDFLAIDNRMSRVGLKKIRRIGHTMEFEQIKEYVRGDDVRTINWKTTAKHGQLMVNQYQDEKSQPIYAVINTGRVMKMPFEELKLLDYAINSTLAFSNIALKKKDKVGLLTYANHIDNFLPASDKKTHLPRILETLYNIDTDFFDSDLGLLYVHLKRKITQRSLVMLYTNFEHKASLERQLLYLKMIAKKHLLVVIFFENTELKGLVERPVDKLGDIYDQTIATQFKNDKTRMLKRLRQNGIQAILTTPQNLTVNTINKYLELKSRGLL